MEPTETALRKTFKYKLKPPPQQEWELERVLGLCCRRYNVALEHRKIAYERRHVSISRYGHEAELKEIRSGFPEYAAIHSHVLQDVLARLDKTFQAFFRRLKAGEKPGYPRFKPSTRYMSFCYKEFGNGAPSTMAFWSFPRSGALRCGGPARWTARPRPSPSAEKRTAGLYGIWPLYTALSGSWLNMAESLQRILVRRALAGQHPERAEQLIAWLEQTVAGWNRHPTSFVWNGARRRRRERVRLRRLGGSGAAIRHSYSIAT